MSGWAWIGWTLAGAGLVLTAWALLWDRARGRKRCPRCWYDVAGADGSTCPECGREVRGGRDLSRTRRRWRWAAAGVLLLAGARAAMLVPAIERDGWASVLPIRVVHAVLAPFDGWGAALYERGERTGWARLRAGGVSQWERLLLARQVSLRAHKEVASGASARPGQTKRHPADVCFGLLGGEGRIALPAYVRLLASDDSCASERARRLLRGHRKRADLISGMVSRHLPRARAEHALAGHFDVLMGYAGIAQTDVAPLIEAAARPGLSEMVRAYCVRATLEIAKRTPGQEEHAREGLSRHPATRDLLRRIEARSDGR